MDPNMYKIAITAIICLTVIAVVLILKRSL